MCNHREQLLRRQVDLLEKKASLCKEWEHALKGDAKTLHKISNGVSNSDEDNKQKLEQLEKEHFEIVEEFQLWVEDGNQKNKPLEDIVKNQMMIT